MKLLSFRNSFGFTLIEALVALLVLAVGVLGLATMQLKAMQGAHVSYQRSVATMAAQDMVERLWIQLGMQAVGSSSVVCPDVKDDVLVKSSDPLVVTEQLSETVLDQWYEKWSVFIPSLVKNNAGSGGSDTVARNGCRYTITVKWNDERFASEEVSELVYLASIIGEVPEVTP
ncbi:type IV pilus modification protein PilV [Halomonas lysinitropha]|uniref:type IV pilus modification protein PilV n=1 Tax=Halomonas lysinitropha TaxID=2607506 RepID=UPI00124AB00C|nr:type IV pilus modification protein PilV [Halomonas lysinitropha]